MARLFVYGTLKKNQRTHHLLKSLNADFVDEATTDDQYKLYKIGWFPGMVEGSSGDGDGGVKGEVYEVSSEALRAIDRYEGVSGGLFVQKEINTSAGKSIVYLYNGEIEEASLVESGVWEP